ncbi:MAG: tetratricopeptide repeat protein [Pseudomonadota bacterium]
MKRYAVRFAAMLIAVASLASLSVTSAHADARTDCFSDDNQRRLTGCSTLLQDPATGPFTRAKAHASRAYALSMAGRFQQAIRDYDAALKLDPAFALAWNNRAWSLFKLGRAAEGLPDVERAIALNPSSPHAFDTRAHIRQRLGQPERSYRDYVSAIMLGGTRLTRLYQCGLQERGLYLGPLDGRDSQELRKAMRVCVKNTRCDPLPVDEHCRQATS